MKTNCNSVARTSSVSSGFRMKLFALVVAGAVVSSLSLSAQSEGFALNLSNNPSDAGEITVDPAPSSDGRFEPGTVVTITATPSGTNEFLGWSGTVESTDNPLTITMDSDVTLTANYSVPQAAPVQIVWQHATGKLATWFVSGANVLSAISFGNTAPAWKAVESGDLNGDGTPDVIFQNDTGKIGVWIMQNNTHSSVTIGTVNPSYRIVGVADFDGDTQNDILFQHASGRLTLWLMNGFTRSSTVNLGRAPSSYRVASVFDYDGDGDPDLLFQHGNGRLLAWIMEGARQQSSATVPAPAKGWRLVGVEDLNGDGKPDFVFQHGDGRMQTWYMDGTTPIATKALRKGKPVGKGWRVVGVTRKEGK